MTESKKKNPIQRIKELSLDAFERGGIDLAITTLAEIAEALRDEISGLELDRMELFIDEMAATLQQGAGRFEEARIVHLSILERAREPAIHPDKASHHRFIARELTILAELSINMGSPKEARSYLEELGSSEEIFLEESAVRNIAATAMSLWDKLDDDLGPGEKVLGLRLIRAFGAEIPEGNISGKDLTQALMDIFLD